MQRRYPIFPPSPQQWGRPAKADFLCESGGGRREIAGAGEGRWAVGRGRRAMLKVKWRVEQKR